jgi:NAD(P)-dependent dehydrogenase (short-subunit alcohol dehydrogenase family)
MLDNNPAAERGAMDPKGQVAVVTGAASGLGAATAQVLAAAGAKVALLDVNEKAASENAGKLGGLAVACDVTSETSAVDAFATIRYRLGTPRILVNCAGIGPAKRILGREGPMPLADYRKVIEINLIGTFNMLRLAAAEMSKAEPLPDGERGVIVSTASIAAFEGQVGQAAYASSKGGVAALTLPAARELAQFAIRVVGIAPGIFGTPMLLALPQETQDGLGASVPFPKRLGAPREFGELVLSIVRNGYLNGEVIRIDGALRMAPR